jgi:uncharacterized protein (DUF1800 family)
MPAAVVAGLNRPAGTLDASQALAPYRGPWNQRTAAHLLRRAGFGGTPAQQRALAAMSPHAAVESLIHFSPATGAPDDILSPWQQVAALRTADDMTRRASLADIRKQERESIHAMQVWWLNQMLTTASPLQEKMTLYFHGHFTTAAIEKGVYPDIAWQQNQLFRSSALGNLRALTLAVSQDPAMLIYLDNARNNRAHPNENYARELMELFTLGRGNYNEQDVRESARAFTGWSVDYKTGQFVLRPRQHDDGEKNFLGQTGYFDGTDIVNVIYRQPAASRFWAQSLLGFFVYNDPEPELIEAVAAQIRKSDFDLAPVMSVLLQSNVFFSDRAYRALVKSPVEFVVGAHQGFGLDQIQPNAPRALSSMGQILFYPPNVAGWPGGENWITSQTIIARQNFAASLVNSPMMQQSGWLAETPADAERAAETLIANILQSDAPPQAATQLVGYLNGAGTSALGMFSGENFQERVRGAAYLAMAMPAYQLN